MQIRQLNTVRILYTRTMHMVAERETPATQWTTDLPPCSTTPDIFSVQKAIDTLCTAMHWNGSGENPVLVNKGFHTGDVIISKETYCAELFFPKMVKSKITKPVLFIWSVPYYITYRHVRAFHCENFVGGHVEVAFDRGCWYILNIANNHK